jgi:hypothetical protein
MSRKNIVKNWNILYTAQVLESVMIFDLKALLYVRQGVGHKWRHVILVTY